MASMRRVLLDTNIIILHLSGQEVFSFDLGEAVISAVSVCELLQYPGIAPDEEQAIRTIISACEVVPVTESIAEHAAIIGRTRKVGTVDLLIAATALELGIPLITRNLRHFKGIHGLEARMKIKKL